MERKNELGHGALNGYPRFRLFQIFKLCPYSSAHSLEFMNSTEYKYQLQFCKTFLQIHQKNSMAMISTVQVPKVTKKQQKIMRERLTIVVKALKIIQNVIHERFNIFLHHDSNNFFLAPEQENIFFHLFLLLTIFFSFFYFEKMSRT